MTIMMIGNDIHLFFRKKKKIESKKDPDLDKNKSLNLRRSYSMESS